MDTVRNWLETISDRPLKIAAGVLALAGAILLYAGTGKQILVDTTGRVERFRRRYGQSGTPKQTEDADTAAEA